MLEGGKEQRVTVSGLLKKGVEHGLVQLKKRVKRRGYKSRHELKIHKQIHFSVRKGKRKGS